MLVNRDTAPVGYVGYGRYDGYPVRVTKQEDGQWVDEQGTGLINSIPIFDTLGEAATGHEKRSSRRKADKYVKNGRTRAEMSHKRDEE